MKTSREEVYAAVDLERDYQDEEHSANKTLLEEIELIEEYCRRATFEGLNGERNALRNIRKIAGIAVRCMENHGAPKR